MRILTKKKLPAFNTIELLTSVIFISLLLTATYSVFYNSLRAAELARLRNLGELLAHDLLELTISRRNENWNSINTGQFHFVDSPTGYAFTSGPETIDQYTRYVDIAEVRRNSSGVIVQSGGTVDPNTFKATATVTWTYGTESFNMQLVRYITNWGKF